MPHGSDSPRGPPVLIGSEPASDRQTPENLAATLYTALGIPRTAGWQDTDGRPYEVYRGEPIPGLT